MEVYLLTHSVIAFICYYLTYCAKYDLPHLKIKPLLNLTIGFLLGWLGLIIVLIIIFYEISKHHVKGE